MKVSSINVYPQVHKPDHTNRIGDLPKLNSNSKGVQVKFGIIDRSNHDILELSSIEANNRLIDAGAITELSHSTNQLKRSDLGGTSHYFLSQTLDFVTYQAKGYANYLNPDAFKDEDIFKSPYYEYDKLYDKSTKAIASNYAKAAIEYFGMKEASYEEIDKLTTQFSAIIKEYGELLAKDSNETTGKLQNKLTINGVDLTFEELNIVTEAIKNINDNLDNPTMTNYINFAQLGLSITQMNYLTRNYLSEDAGKMIMSSYHERVKGSISKHNEMLDLSRNFRKILSQKIENRIGGMPSHIPQENDIYMDEYYRLDTKFEDGAKKDIMNWFSSIDVTDKDTIKVGFQESIGKFNSFENEWAIQRQYGLYSDEVVKNNTLIMKSYTTFFSKF